MATQKLETEKARFENIAQAVGKKYGYDKVSVDITAFSDFKFKWTRSYKWADFTCSDYLVGAPDEVIEGIFDVVFGRITGESNRPYSSATSDFLTAKKFASAHRKSYLSRHKAESQMFREFNGAHVHFSKKSMSPYTLGYASTLMNTIILNPILKDESEEVIQNAIAHEYNVIQEGLDNFGKRGEPVPCDTEALSNYVL